MGGFPDPDWGCRRHPNHKQLPGVCSVCLSESLMRLTTAEDDDSDYATASPSFSPAVAPKAVAEPKQTSFRHPHRRRNGSDDHGAMPLGFLLDQGTGNGKSDGDFGFKKSRSVGCGPRIYRGVNGNLNSDGGEIKEKKGGGGFWRKLMHTTSKKTKGVLMHSSTMKQRSGYNTCSSSSRKLR